MENIDGFYVGYFTGLAGSGQAVFVLRDGVLVGADPLGVKFDGHYTLNGDKYVGAVKVTAPANGHLVQGVNSGPSGLNYEVQISLPLNFAESGYLGLQTPLGPVNLKLSFMRSL